MRKLDILVSAVASSFCVALAQTPERPLTSFPYTPGLDVNAMDKSADPCVDFYQYTCGRWMEKNPAAHDEADRRCDGQGHRAARWDELHHQGTGVDQAAGDRQQDRLSRQVARL